VNGVGCPVTDSLEDFRRHRWPSWVATVEEGLDELRLSCDRVVVFAQSFGAALAVHLAVTRAGQVDGLALSSRTVRPALMLVPIARLVVKERKGVGDDIRKEHLTETAYERIRPRRSPRWPTS